MWFSSSVPCFYERDFSASTGQSSVGRWHLCLLALLLLTFTTVSQAISPTMVGLAIENDIDSNGNITVIEGQKVKVAWVVEANLDKLLNKKDRIELLRVDNDEVLASVQRGKGQSGVVALKVKKAAGLALYVRYILKGTDTTINSISHPEDIDDTPLLAIANASSSALNLRLNSLEVKTVFAVGDTGPAGGIVFYVTDDGLHGLESAPADLAGLPKWGCMFELLYGAQGTLIGWGADNTRDILRGCSEAGTAAALADAYSMNGYYDWYLPSKDELALMRLNIGQAATDPVNQGNFANDFYWSSSQFDDANAWALRLGDGLSQALNKFDTLRRARAIRSF